MRLTPRVALYVNLLWLVLIVLIVLLTACKAFPDRDERDAGTVLDVVDEADGTATVTVRRASDGVVYHVTGLDGTPCRIDDYWPECH